jgi:hypothetical protein
MEVTVSMPPIIANDKSTMSVFGSTFLSFIICMFDLLRSLFGLLGPGGSGYGTKFIFFGLLRWYEGKEGLGKLRWGVPFAKPSEKT